MRDEAPENPERAQDPPARRPERDVPGSPLLEQAQKWILHHSVEHLHGPREVDYTEDELVVLCLVRNGRPYLRSFLEHYLSLSARHLVFLDNGSSDGTVEFLESRENVTVLRTGLPFKRYQLSIKRYLIERFGTGRWTLSVDIDELFDYPYSDVVGLGSFLEYLSANGYTAVAAQMLDMFPERPPSDTGAVPEDVPLKELHRFYDTSNVRVRGYFAHRGVCGTGNVLANEEIKAYWDGIQATVFGDHPPLTKHPLIFFDGEVKPMDRTVHAVSNARVADLTCVFYHYKFLDGLHEQLRRAAREGNYMRDSYKQRVRLQVLERTPDLRIKRETAKELRNVNELLDDGFLVVSERYMDRVAAEHGEDGPVDSYLKSRVRAQAQKIRRLERRVEELRGRLARLRRRARELEESNRNLAAQVRNVRSSTTRKLLGEINRLKARVMRRG